MAASGSRARSTTPSDGSGSSGGLDDGGLLLVAGADLLTTFPISRAEVSIGRDSDCDISLPHSLLSRKHVQLRLGPPLTVQDLDSTNGTRVGGKLCKGGAPVPLAVGESFRIGRLSCVVLRLPNTRTRASSVSMVEALHVIDPTVEQASPLLRDIARSGVNVLILGETGVGKEVLADTLHQLAAKQGPLLRINCAALAPSLLESELFGHERGAFTGAGQSKPGLLEAASRGTAFLDEVGELPQPLQAKLLRVLESKEVMRVGAVRPIAIDARFIAATNRDLPADVAAGTFRADLYFRLDGVTLVIPPLRQRPQLLAPLAMRFVREAHERLHPGKQLQLAPSVLTRLDGYGWPGNVRELKAVMERAVLLARGREVESRHVVMATKPTRSGSRTKAAEVAAPAAQPISDSDSDEGERQQIIDALLACAGNQTRAARQLGISRTTLSHKLALHRIPRPRK